MEETKLTGTRTEQCLINSFAGESQARNRYTYFSSVAKKEGYEQIAAIFLETANNEKEHAKLFYKHLGSGRAKVYEAIVKGDNLPESSVPESFNVLIRELMGLGLDIKID